ncbi:TVP38/TMEM64 family protein [Streptomyces sp. WMMC1477]|uniref:TVP38/TMEM64 family protein n=1 Tax=Streptomyces sp. WMMC1477 TaxID=3015155 RepID=UPI0022B70E73|nr:TVP38/TMEM64 family protein [Streptomyces sp. WMMC1477]MCZ7434670.1 TVP38/TMEM64 family protein [Streptomyces sp. WMMC1477]
MPAPTRPNVPHALGVPLEGPAGTDVGRPVRTPWPRLGALVVLLAAGAAAVAVFEPQRFLGPQWLGTLPTAVAVGVFVLGYGLGSAAFVPRPVLSLAAGLLFGAGTGTATALAGSVLGAAVAFGLGRLLGRDALRPLLRGRVLHAGDRLLEQHGFRSVLVLRLLPGVPFALTNYAASVSRVRWSAVLAGTAVGSVPSTAAYALAGGRATDPASSGFLAASGFLVLTGVAGALLARHRRERHRRARSRQRSREPAGAAG